MKVFLKDLCLRPSCYACHSKSLYRNSDITLADFWGIKEVCPEMHDNKGTSLVFINSKKGQELFSKIISNIKYKEVDIKEATKYNPSSFKSVKMSRKRVTFMSGLFSNEFDEYAKKYTKLSVSQIVKNKLITIYLKLHRK